MKTNVQKTIVLTFRDPFTVKYNQLNRKKYIKKRKKKDHEVE